MPQPAIKKGRHVLITQGNSLKRMTRKRHPFFYNAKTTRLYKVITSKQTEKPLFT